MNNTYAATNGAGTPPVALKSPREVLLQKILSKKYLFIAIVMSVSVLFTVINAVTNDPISQLKQLIHSVDSSSIGQLLDLQSLLSPVMGVLHRLQVVIRTLIIIGQIPNIALMSSFWFLYLGVKLTGKQNLMFVGSLILQIIVMIKIIEGCVLPVALLVLGFATLKAIGSPILLVILLIGVSLYCLIYLQFFIKLFNMLHGVIYTINTDRNQIYVYSYVLFGYWWRGIWGILGAFSGGFAAIVGKICMSLAYIFIALLFSDFKKEVGQADPKLIKETKQNMDAYRQEVAQRAAAGEFVIWFQKGQAAPSQPAYTSTVSSKPAPASRSAKPAARPVQTTASVVLPELADRKAYASSNEELTVNILKLFDADIQTVSTRFKSLGLTTLTQVEKAPIRLTQTQLLTDTISDRRILRIEAQNISEIGISEIELSIIPKGDMFNPLGCLNAVKYRLDQPINKDEKCLTEFGIVLPDDATNGEIRVQRVTFEDGLFWDKGCDAYRFSSDEKKSFDKSLYLKLHGEA